MNPIPLLALKGIHRDAYNAIVRPERKFAVSHYFLRRWGPLLGPARSWLVIALRQRCFWNSKQDWCVVDSATLAQEAALSRRAFFLYLNDKGFLPWFFRRERQQRYHRSLRRSVRAPNFYTVRLDDPLVPADQAGLAAILHQALSQPDPFQAVEETIAHLLNLKDHLLAEELARAAVDAPPFIGEGFTVYDVLREVTPEVKNAGAERKTRLGHLCSALQSKITRPERVYLGTQYFRLKWLPLLGHTLASFIVALRTRCYWNEKSGELRDICQVSLEEIAAEIGCSSRHLRRLRRRKFAPLFFEELEAEAGQGHFQVQMADPLTPEDRSLFAKMVSQRKAPLQTDSQTGQFAVPPPPEEEQSPPKPPSPTEDTLEEKGEEGSGQPSPSPGAEDRTDIFALGGRRSWPVKADIFALGADTFALGDRGFGEVEGVPVEFEVAKGAEIFALGAEIFALGGGKNAPGAEIFALGAEIFALGAEIFALRCGNFCTTVKVLISTSSTGRKLQQQYLRAPEKSFAAAATSLLLDCFGLKEPGKGHLLEAGVNYVDAFAWMLYAITQPRLEGRRKGYVYNRLIAGDPPPDEFRLFARLPAPVWNLFYRAERYGTDVPEKLRPVFQRWCEVYAGFFPAPPFPEAVVEESRKERGEKVGERDREGEEIWLKALAELEGRVDGDLLEDLRRCRVSRLNGARKLVVFVEDLLLAHRLSQVKEVIEGATGYALEMRDFDTEEVIGREVQALENLSPLPTDFWPTALAELALQMSQAAFNSWLRDSKLVGKVRTDGAEEEIVIAVRNGAAREWLENRQRDVIEKTLARLLGQPVSVRFVVMYDADVDLEGWKTAPSEA